MSTVMIRGKSLTWINLCDECNQIYFKMLSEKHKHTCCLCNEKFSGPEGIKICNACSFETQVCMNCGKKSKFGMTPEELMDKSLGKRKKKKNVEEEPECQEEKNKENSKKESKPTED